ncbi:MAG: hypothetical protein IKB70_02480 [Bacilli bacterium]|nr:hypothetical protein [Bacilli bacterium]
MTLKNKLLVVFANLVVIGIVLGLNLAFTDLSNSVRVATLICMIVTLLMPSAAILLIKKFDSPETIVTIIAMVANLIATVIMFATNLTDSKPLIITESIIGGVYVVLLALTIGLKGTAKQE